MSQAIGEKLINLASHLLQAKRPFQIQLACYFRNDRAPVCKQTVVMDKGAWKASRESLRREHVIEPQQIAQSEREAVALRKRICNLVRIAGNDDAQGLTSNLSKDRLPYREQSTQAGILDPPKTRVRKIPAKDSHESATLRHHIRSLPPIVAKRKRVVPT